VAARGCVAIGKLDREKGAAFTAWKTMVAEECAIFIGGLDPAAIAKEGQP